MSPDFDSEKFRKKLNMHLTLNIFLRYKVASGTVHIWKLYSTEA